MFRIRATIATLSLHFVLATAAGSQQLQDVWVLGALDGPEALTEVGEILRLPTGDLAVAQSDDGQVLIVAPDGSIKSRIGGRGQGPGEFRRVHSLSWVGDELIVVDLSQFRFSAFGEDLGHRETRRIPVAQAEPPVTFSGPAFKAVDGFVVIGSAIGPAAESIEQYPVALVDETGVIKRRLATVKFGRRRARVQFGGSTMTLGRRYHEGTQFAISPHGSFFVTADPLDVADDDLNSWARIRIWDLVQPLDAVEVTTSVRRERFPDRLATEIVRRHVDYLRLDRPAAEQLRRGLDLPSFWPPVTHVTVDSDDRIWLRVPPAIDGRGVWRVMDRTGETLFEVSGPERLTILEAKGEAVWGTFLDESDVPHVVQMRVTRSGQRP